MKHCNTREGIAIIGIGAIMPGASNKDIFWKNILEGKSSIVEVPPDRWDWHLYYDPDPKAPDKTYSKIGGFVEDFKFDPLKHRIPPQVSLQMARLQHMAIETSVMALKDSGYDKKPYDTQRTAVILGNAMGGMKKEETDLRVYRAYYNDVLSKAKSFSSLPANSRQAILEEVDQKISTSLGVITEDTMPGELSNVTSGRIASILNVNGPNYTVDAACASSIAALDQAMKGLRLNDFDMAICGGADEMMSAPAYVKFCKIGALSPDGSWVFDARANGFVMAEGVGIFVLKRISDAVKDGDRIYAVINAVGSSSDGKGKAITAPNPKGQKLAIERTFQQLNYTPADISFMEAHGTATRAGDIAEGKVLHEFFSPYISAKGSLWLGSVKSNIGHTKAAAGAASLAKMAMALHNKIFPPSINFVIPNPSIDFKNSPFRVITKTEEWSSPNRPRRANISSFGFGGSNFHVALEEYDEKTTRLPDPRLFEGLAVKPPELKVPSLKLQSETMTISAPTREALLNKVDSLITSTNMAENWPMVLFTHPFNTSRHEHFAVSLTADSPSKLKTKLKFLTEQSKTSQPWEKPSLHLKMKGIYPFHPKPSEVKIGFLFPGQGSQYIDMMKDLASKYQIVQDTFDEADVILKKLINTTLTEVLYSKPGESASELARREDAIKQTQMTQPAVLTADTAMLRLLDSFGVRPDMVCGHSLGEYAAAVAAGIFTFENGIRAVTSRAKEMSNIKVDDPGKMASVALSFEKVERELKKINGYVICANKNCPTQTVIAGEKTAVTEAVKLFTSMGVQAGEIPVSHAFHSAIIKPASEPYSRFLEKIPVSKPVVPILSNVTADYFPSDEKGIRDLLVRQIINPVEFIRQLERMYADGARLFVECGPKRVLSAFATGTLHDKKDIHILSSNHPKRGGILEFNDMLSKLTASGVELNWNGKNPLDSGNVYAPAYADWAAKHHFTYKTPEADRITVSRSAGPSPAWEKHGFNSNPIVITGIAAGTPGSWDKLFREGNIDEILRGQNLIEPVSRDMQQKQIDKNIIRVIKSATGEHRIERVTSTDQAIKLAAVKGEFDLEKEFGVPKTVVNAMDSTFRMALAVGILALRDAGLPLMRLYKKTSTGRYLPERWALPESVGDDTGVIFASAFPIAESIITEVSDHLVERFRNQSLKEIWTVYDSMIQKIHDPKDRQALSTWFAQNFNRYHEAGGKGPHTFSQNFLLKAIPIGNSQFAQWVRARGPSMHLSAACASTTESVGVAEDWIRTGRAKRVVIIAADDITSEAIQDWYLAGFVASGAATTEGRLSEAAIPFDRRRHGLIVGTGAVGIVVEDETLAKERGMKPLVRLLGSEFANSGFHVTRLDTNHVAEVLDRLMTKVEKTHGLDRSKIAGKTLFMSHETYTPARGGSASAEVVGLKRVFGKDVGKVVVSNVKGFTGHTMGASLEDVVAIRALNTGQVPPIANYKEPDPELAGITLSKGGKYDLEYALHFAAGFGSQMAATFVQRTFKEGESRFEDPVRYKNWLQKVSGNAEPELEVKFNTLRIKDTGTPKREPGKEKEAVIVSAVPAPTASQPSASSEGLPSTAGTMTTTVPSPSAPSVEVPPQSLAADSSSVSEESVKITILDMISNKTGYPKDMLELDLDMEADLGIDTVKQAELFAAMREHYSIPRREGAALKDYPTIRHCIKFVMEEKASTTGAATAPATKPAPTPAPVASPASADLSGMEDEVRETILNMISGKTGYPKDMLELDLDMEADLGIDTVKQAELFAAMREHYSIPRREGAALKDYPTIRHCIKFVMEEKASTTGAATAPATKPEPTPAPSIPTPATTPVSAALTVSPVSDRALSRGSAATEGSLEAAADLSGMETEVKEIILGMISKKTGYPKDMLELDLDMEADLGIDTVKQAELFAAMREHYSIPRREGEALKDYPTIRHCIKFVMEEKANADGAASPASADSLGPEQSAQQSRAVTGPSPAPPSTAIPVGVLIPPHTMRGVGAGAPDSPKAEGSPTEDGVFAKSKGAPLPEAEDTSFRPAQQGTAVIPAPAAKPVPTPAPSASPVSADLSGPGSPGPLQGKPAPSGKTAAAPVSRHVRYVPTLVQCPVEKEIIRKLSSKKPIVIFSDDAALIKAFSTELDNLKVVYHIFTSSRLKSKNSSALDWTDLSSVEKALTSFAAKNPKVQGVIYLLGCEPKNLNENTLAHKDLTRMAIPLFLAGKYFNNGLSNPDESFATFMAVVTRVDGAFGYRTDASYDPIYGAVSAIAYCLRKELPKSSVKLVDFSPAMTPSAIAKKTLYEVLRSDTRLGIGYHSGKRWTLVMKPVTLAKGKGLDLKGKAVLVTGGGRGLGAEFSKILAARHQPRIIIMDIIDLQDKTPQWAAMTEDQLKTLKNEIWTRLKSSSGRKATPVMLEKAFAKVKDSIQLYRTMEDIKRLGSEVAYFFCDVTDHDLFNDVLEKIRSRYGKIDGIVHFAGIERSKLAVDKTLAEFFKVFDTKAVSAMMLVNSGVIKEGGFKVFISSIAGRFGNVGQTDYAAASDYLSKLAVSLTNRGERALTVDMSAYADIGMAMRPGVEAFLKSQNLEFLYPNEGMETICDELVYGKVPEIVLSAGLGKLDLDKQLEVAGGHAKTGRHAKPVTGYPMIEKMMEHEHGKKLLAIKEFSLEKDPYLRDHSIKGTPYVPGVMGIETFVETANLFWKKPVYGLENVSFSLPVKLLRNNPVEIRINALQKPGDALEMSMESDFVNPQGVKLGSARTHFTAQAIKSPVSPSAWDSIDKPAVPQIDFKVSHDVIYKAFFHGPSFKVLGGILRLDPKSLLSVYKKPSRPIWPEDPAKTEGLLAHPLLIEAAIQTCGYRDLHFTKRMTLPDAIKRVLIFTHGKEPNMLFVYSIFKGQDNSGKSRYDAFVFDKDGKLWIEINDYLMIPV